MTTSDLNNIVTKLYDKYSRTEFYDITESYGILAGWTSVEQTLQNAGMGENKRGFIKKTILAIKAIEDKELSVFLAQILEPNFSLIEFTELSTKIYDYLDQLADIPLFFNQTATVNSNTYGGSREAVYRNAVLAHLKATYKQNSGLITAESLQKGGKVDISIQSNANEKLLIAEFKIRSGHTIIDCLKQLTLYTTVSSLNLSVFILEEGGDTAYQNAINELDDFVVGKTIIDKYSNNAFLLNGTNILKNPDPIERNLFISVFHTPKGNE